MLYKLENDRLIPAPVNFRTDSGKWIINFNQSPELMAKYGWRDWSEEEIEAWKNQQPTTPPPARTICTKYELVRCLQTHFPELLASLRSAYAANSDLQFFWNSVLDLDRENADFRNIVSQLGITSEQLDAIFAKL